MGRCHVCSRMGRLTLRPVLLCGWCGHYLCDEHRGWSLDRVKAYIDNVLYPQRPPACCWQAPTGGA